jgi:hypothetical protein
MLLKRHWNRLALQAWQTVIRQPYQGVSARARP